MLPRPASKIIRNASRYPVTGFQPASAWYDTATYRDRTTITNFNAFKKVDPKNVKKFQIWQSHAKVWNNRITSIPIIINERDLIQWQHFKTQKLKLNQLYLWRASYDEWIPLWAMETGFLLINYEFIRYSDVSLDQFMRIKWIKLNCVSTTSINQLVAQFGKDISIFGGFNRNYTQNQKLNQTITGTPYYCRRTGPIASIRLYQNETRGWTKYGIFSKKDQRFSYNFLKFFHKTIHCSNLPGRNNAKDFVEAAITAIRGRSYIYHENDKYIPFWKTDDITIRINSSHYLKINTLSDNINNINLINNNRHNILTRNEFNICQRNRSQFFIDTSLMKYRIEFIINCVGSIKYEDWSQAQSLDDFAAHAQIADTLFLLTQDGYYGFPIGVSPYEDEEILLNNGSNVSVKQMQEDYKNRKIPTGIALDFNGIETLIDKNGIHEQYDPITQQLAKITNIKSLNIQGFLAGQYILLDFNTPWLLPIYVLNNLYVRTQRRIVHVQDLQMYHDSFYKNDEFINKNYIQMEYTIVKSRRIKGK